jgi:hypothetical protein
MHTRQEKTIQPASCVATDRTSSEHQRPVRPSPRNVEMVAEIFGIHIGLALSVPGIFFEVGLPLWLFVKGFQPEAYSGHAEVVTTVRPALATS